RQWLRAARKPSNDRRPIPSRRIQLAFPNSQNSPLPIRRITRCGHLLAAGFGRTMTKPSSEPLVEIERASKRYGDKLAVSELSFELYPGEVFAFLGPNGAGKTTTIKMMTGLLRPTSGKVRVAGFDMAGESLAARRLLSFV